MVYKENILAKRGKKPLRDMYRIYRDEMQALCEEIIYSYTSVETEVTIDEDDEQAGAIRVYIEPKGYAASKGQLLLTEEQRKELMKHNFDPDDSIGTAHELIAHIAGGTDSGAEYGWREQHSGEIFIDIYTPPRIDVLDASRDALGKALGGTREETIIAINKIIKRSNYERTNLQTGEEY